MILLYDLLTQENKKAELRDLIMTFFIEGDKPQLSNVYEQILHDEIPFNELNIQ